jgi:hypothetical protein
LSSGSRYGIYWAPAQHDKLWHAGSAWLGRDVAGGTVWPPLSQRSAQAEEITRAARLYGFHATLKPPMRLQPDVSAADLLQALATVTAGVPPFMLPPLAVTDWHGFLCLRETQESAALQALADAMVAGLDHLRAPISARELAHRRAAGLSPEREANLRRWGYPDVFGTWFFHMTLTRRLTASELAVVRPTAEAWFATALAEPQPVTDVCVFEQPEAGAAFTLAARTKLGGYGPVTHVGGASMLASP